MMINMKDIKLKFPIQQILNIPVYNFNIKILLLIVNGINIYFNSTKFKKF